MLYISAFFKFSDSEHSETDKMVLFEFQLRLIVLHWLLNEFHRSRKGTSCRMIFNFLIIFFTKIQSRSAQGRDARYVHGRSGHDDSGVCHPIETDGRWEVRKAIVNRLGLSNKVTVDPRFTNLSRLTGDESFGRERLSRTDWKIYGEKECDHWLRTEHTQLR